MKPNVAKKIVGFRWLSPTCDTGTLGQAMKISSASLWLFAAMLIVVSKSHAGGRVPVAFEAADIPEHCFIFSLLIDTPEFRRREGKPFLDEKIVIDNQRAYEEFQRTVTPVRNAACKEVNFPSIDFSRKTLLGNWASGSCAAVGFQRTVVKDSEKKELVYSVKVQERAISCTKGGLQSLNLITIRKIPSGYKVRFEPATDHSMFQTYSLESGKTVARDWWGNIVPRRTQPPPGGGIYNVEIIK